MPDRPILDDSQRRGASRRFAKLEELAGRCGYRSARLETGVRIEPYGRYANDPLSLCFEKSLEAKAIS
jgi:hypothetical protein